MSCRLCDSGFNLLILIQKQYINSINIWRHFPTELIQGQFKDTDYKVALIVFLHTHGRNGRYNPHLHVILAEGAFHPRKKEWKAFKHLPLAPLRRLWQ